MRPSMLSPQVRADFLDALADCGTISAAAARVGVPLTMVAARRKADAEFAAAVTARHHRPGQKRPPMTRAEGRQARARFLAVLGETGQVQRALVASGLPFPTAYAARQRDAVFAAEWASARNRALDRVEDRLFDGALNGFRRSETFQGKTRVTVSQSPATMFKLLGRRSREGGRYKTIELTPELVADAHDRVRRYIRLGVVPGEETVAPPVMAA